MVQRRMAQQRTVVVEQLREHADDIVFELLSDILEIEREHRERKHGVKVAIKAAVERFADHDLPEDYV